MLSFAVNLSRRSDGSVVATFPDVPMAVAYGRSDAEALANAEKALSDALDQYAQSGFELPVARSRGQHMMEIEAPRIAVPA